MERKIDKTKVDPLTGAELDKPATPLQTVPPGQVTPAGNSTAGIDLPGIHSHDNLIGGSAAGAGNVIAFAS